MIPGKRSILKKFLLLLLIAGVVGYGTWRYLHRTAEPPTLAPTAVTYNAPPQKESTEDTSNKPLPSSLLIKVPFTPQAPTANWDELHNEACEEASAIMANAYFNQIKSLPAADVESELERLTAWQNDTYGYHLSVSTDEVARMIESVYNLDAEVMPLTEDNIKQSLADNKLVLWPGNGQLLKNPYYKQPGPIYHMMVITGYNEKGFITNDPGTKRGQDLQYTYDILHTAAGTWNHDRHGVDLTDKKIIIVSQ
jgi:hypothetical protein